MLRIIRKVIDKYVVEYKTTREHELIRQLAYLPEKSGISIAYPFTVSHPELISIGKGTTILEYSRIQPYPELVGGGEPCVTIGERCFFGYRLCILAGADITIGNDVLFASDILIVSHNHGINPEENVPYMKQKLDVAPIDIGDNCWIGDKAIILSGVSIGRGCVIGGGAVVTKSIPEYSIAVGNPARIIKRYDFANHTWAKV